VIEGHEDLAITGIAMIDDAGEGELTFIGDEQHARRWANAASTVALVSNDLELGEWARSSRTVIRVQSADHAMIQVLQRVSVAIDAPPVGIHPTAQVDPTATVGEDVCIGSCVIIGPGCSIGARAIIESGARLHSGVQMGDDCRLYSNVVLYQNTVLGSRVSIHANAVIGADGFGYRPSLDGSGVLKIPHVGNVILGDDVEIGANTCIDRAKFGSTTIGAHTKIDNLCQIGHNCRIGKACFISGQTGIGGSSVVGNFVQIAGQVGIADHLTIGDRARITGKAGVMKSVPPDATWAGTPAHDVSDAWREQKMLRKLPGWSKKLKQLLKDD
jgi:UDP-3-O-[3-hydroxymyristoyl] glucosamine N-acyltransferase